MEDEEEGNCEEIEDDILSIEDTDYYQKKIGEV